MSNATAPLVEHDTFREPDTRELEQKLNKACEDRVFPGAVVLVGKGEQQLGRFVVGKRNSFSNNHQNEESTTADKKLLPDTIFDVGTLTRVIVTVPLIMKLAEQGALNLHDRISRYLQEFGVYGKSPITILQLLNHSSGLPGSVPFYQELLRKHSGSRIGILASRGARQFVQREINYMKLRSGPGEVQQESEVGMILLGFLIEVLTGTSLEVAAQRLIFQPLSMQNSSYVHLGMLRRRTIVPVENRIAPTLECPWRKRLLCGEASDENAWAMGGVSGANGVFSNADDLSLFCRELIRSSQGQGAYFIQSTVQAFWRWSGGKEKQFSLGWEKIHPGHALAETGLAPETVGITSPTGCGLWIDPSDGFYLVFLSNALHPTGVGRKFSAFFPDFMSEVVNTFRVKD